MRKISGYALACLLVISAIVPCVVSAGDPEHPEIKDEVGDVYGTLIAHPFIVKVLNIFGLLDVEAIDSIDIVSAWFYEYENGSDYLFMTIQIKNLEFSIQREAYLMVWMGNGTKWNAYFTTHSEGKFTQSAVGEFETTTYYDIESWFNVENDTITFKVPKNLIGDPKQGDILTHTFVKTYVDFQTPLLAMIFRGSIHAVDFAFGDNYQIQY